MTLAAFQQTFMDLALKAEVGIFENRDTFITWLNSQPDLTAELQSAFMAQPLSRLEQYQYMVQANLNDTLEGIYPLTCQLLQADRAALVTAYRLACLPTAYQLFDCVQAFPDFLATNAPVLAQYPYIVELARYEVAEAAVLRLSTPSFTFPQTAPTLSIETLGLLAPVLNPTLKFLDFSYPIPEIVDSLKVEVIPENPLPAELTVAVFRDAEFNARFFRLAPLAAGFLKVLQQQPGLSYQHLLQAALDATVFNGDPAGLVEPFMAYLTTLHARGILLEAMSAGQ